MDLIELPTDIFTKLNEFLTPRSKVRLSQTCRKFRTLYSQDSFWKPHCQKSHIHATENFKEVYLRYKNTPKSYFLLFCENEMKNNLSTYLVRYSYPMKEQEFYARKELAYNAFLNTAQTGNTTCYFIRILGISAETANKLMGLEETPCDFLSKEYWQLLRKSELRKLELGKNRQQIQGKIDGAFSAIGHEYHSLKLNKG